MAAIALLRVILSLDGVDADEVAAVALGFVVAAKVSSRKIITSTAALMTIKAPFLLMALVAVVAGFAGQHTVFTVKVGAVVGCDAFTFVAGIALLDRHCGILFMRDLFCVRLLLEIHQGTSQKRNYEKDFFH